MRQRSTSCDWRRNRLSLKPSSSTQQSAFWCVQVSRDRMSLSIRWSFFVSIECLSPNIATVRGQETRVQQSQSCGRSPTEPRRLTGTVSMACGFGVETGLGDLRSGTVRGQETRAQRVVRARETRAQQSGAGSGDPRTTHGPAQKFNTTGGGGRMTGNWRGIA